MDWQRPLTPVAEGSAGELMFTNCVRKSSIVDWYPGSPSTCSRKICVWCWTPLMSLACPSLGTSLI